MESDVKDFILMKVHTVAADLMDQQSDLVENHFIKSYNLFLVLPTFQFSKSGVGEA